MVPTSETLPAEIRGGNGSGLCHPADVPQEREICWAPKVEHNEERPNSVGEFIWSWGVGIGGYHLLQGWEKVYGNCMNYKGNMVWKVYARVKTSDEINEEAGFWSY